MQAIAKHSELLCPARVVNLFGHEVELPAIPWANWYCIAIDPTGDTPSYKRRAKLTHAEAKGLARIAKDDGANPSEWRVSFEPVPRDKWLAVDVWNANEKRWERVFPESLP